jgi:hypothetical protein
MTPKNSRPMPRFRAIISQGISESVLNPEGVPSQSPGFAYSRTLGYGPVNEMNPEGVPHERYGR